MPKIAVLSANAVCTYSLRSVEVGNVNVVAPVPAATDTLDNALPRTTPLPQVSLVVP